MIAVTGVSKRWTDASGLATVTFAVAAGELVVVQGRSGSGKSTLLALLAGWCAPDSGAIVIAGRTRGTGDQSWFEVAVVPQVLALVPELTVRENVLDVVGVGSGPSVAMAARLDSTLARLGLTELANRFPTELSMGQQQRVAVARAVIGDPAVILADEPTSHQDRGHVHAVVAVLLDAAARGAAVLVASHDHALAAVGQRLVELEA